MRRNEPKEDICALYAPNEERNYYNDFVEGILLPEEKSAFVKHLKSCAICKREVAESNRLHKIVSQSPRLSELGLKRSAARRMKYMDQILSRNLRLDEDLALAASPPRRLDDCGVAYGVAVDLEKHQGVLLECIADVSEVPKLRSKLEIRAIERKTSKIGEKITTPSDHLENILNDLFITHEVLLPFRLWEKAIRVEINCKMGSGYIVEPDSMGLAVLVAILSAVTGKKINKDILFSAGIKFKGYLEGVGDLEDKIQVAKVHRMKTCYTADETRCVNNEKNIKKSGITLYYFDKLEEVLTRLGLHKARPERPSSKNKNRTTSRMKK